MQQAQQRQPHLPAQQRNPPVPLTNGLRAHQNRLSSEMRTRGPIPGHPPNGHARNMSGAAPFEMVARSPPNPTPKNTKHVPCKFFRQGACQAGPACPFLHSTDASVDSAPCKYFTKGNCKFGAKCALAHILPDGRRVNRPNFGLGMGGGSGGGHLNLGGRVNPQAYHNQDSALTNSVLSQQRMNGHDVRYPYPYPGQDDFSALQAQQQQQPPHEGIPMIDTGFVSDAGSKYGSPVDDIRQPASPKYHLTALDAPLPASFDSQGISHVARYGPVAASMPSKFGLELSSLSSPPTQRAPSDVLKSLRDTAFGSDLRKPSSNFGSSPPAIAEDLLGPRFLHSQRMAPRSKVLSASVPRPTVLDDWDDSNFPMEEDYLPVNLHDEVLTPQEKMRRLSRTEHELSSSNKDFGSLGITGTSLTKVGSPLASSPSRFGALFAKQRQKKEEEAAHGGSSSSFSHIGSPLRESSLHLTSSPSLRPIGSRPVSGDISSFVSSPARQSSMSMISQQLSSMSLHPNSALHPTTSTSTSAGPTTTTTTTTSNSRLDRTVSSPVTTSRIDEEQGDLVFSMEEEESNKRTSGVWNEANKSSASNNEEGPSSSSQDLEFQS
ncbi:hypothetical protein VTN77DRAFT_9159 [Rasamsonia byssochlamydoides]|uniref:uncharacterized protein n=1 Tax=Rasamsonia byssochlamydoides TaxID=89139 RepID=UPI00374419DB